MKKEELEKLLKKLPMCRYNFCSHYGKRDYCYDHTHVTCEDFEIFYDIEMSIKKREYNQNGN